MCFLNEGIVVFRFLFGVLKQIVVLQQRPHGFVGSFGRFRVYGVQIWGGGGGG